MVPMVVLFAASVRPGMRVEYMRVPSETFSVICLSNYGNSGRYDLGRVSLPSFVCCFCWASRLYGGKLRPVTVAPCVPPSPSPCPLFTPLPRCPNPPILVESTHTHTPPPPSALAARSVADVFFASSPNPDGSDHDGEAGRVMLAPIPFEGLVSKVGVYLENDAKAESTRTGCRVWLALLWLALLWLGKWGVELSSE